MNQSQHLLLTTACTVLSSFQPGITPELLLQSLKNSSSGAGAAAKPSAQLLTVAEVAASLAVSTRTVWRLVAAGKLTKILVASSVRFRLDDVLQLIDDGTAPAESSQVAP
jgi:excisionase family DNA binding protein